MPLLTGKQAEEDGVVIATNSSWRLANWLAEYASLMRILRADAGSVWSGMAELFELYFLHTFHTFAEVSLADIVQSGQGRRQVRFHSVHQAPA